MAIRTLARRLREHDWLAFLIEVVIVILGVFIGLQVSNWNEERKATARGLDYLRRIEADLHAEARNVGAVNAFWKQVAGYGVAAIAHAEDGTLDQGSAWKTLLAYYQASQVWPLRQGGTTFGEMASSGDLQLIRSEHLRTNLTAHYDPASGSQATEILRLLPPYRERVRGMTPWRIQQYIWANCFRSTDVDQELLDCPSPVSEAQALAIVQAFRADPEITRGLRFWMSSVGAGNIIMKSIREKTDAIAVDVRAELAGAR
ncbi:MAG: hypothetical protein ACREO3_11495 [Arenimonas sp.]